MQAWILSSRTGRSFTYLRALVNVHFLTEFTHLKKDDILISMGYMKRITPDVYDRFLTLNVHPGGLFEFPGRHPQIRALAELDRKKTFVTLHRIQSEEYDTGEVISQVEVMITEKDRDDPNAFFERTRLIGVYLTAAYLIGQGVEAK